MAAAAPEAAQPQEKAEPQAEPRKRSWWRVKVPTSLVVTFVGIALTAWLLPAVTRQWDDRQKAAEVKAEIDSQIAAATARALIGSRQTARTVWQRPPWRKRLQAQGRLRDAWLSDSINIEARLRAHFDSSEVVGKLHAYNDTMDALFAVSAFPDAISGEIPSTLDPPGFYAKDLGLSMKELVSALRLISYSGKESFTPLIDAVLAKENDLTATVSQAHATGYSTTTRDLIHDLLPF
jgi:hypothetical protein